MAMGLLLLGAGLRPLSAAPALVVLLRHGHKDLPSGIAASSNFNLSETGLLQALQLGRFVPACLQQGRRLALVSYGFDPISGKNARSYQTLMPLAVASGVNIRVFMTAAGDSEAIGRQLRSDVNLSGAVLVIAWEHRRLPQLARGLGWSAMPDVEAGDFDSLWLLSFRDGAVVSPVQRRSQQQLLALPCYRRANNSSAQLERVMQRFQAGFGAGAAPSAP